MILKGQKDFLYQRILRPILFGSRLARRSMMGHADSGINFDYIYKNSPTGYTRFGKLVDSVLLNLPASRATRNRQKTFARILKDEIATNIEIGRITRIVDLASGLARYLLEALSNKVKPSVEVLCIDMDQRVKLNGKKMAQGHPIIFIKGNAFRLGKLRKLSGKTGWKPNVIVASGLYANYGEEAFKQSISEIYETLEPGGLFVFDWVVHNPSQQLLERLAVTRSGKPWIMSYGSRDRIIQLVKHRGFTSCLTESDRWGMYIIFRARKNS